MITFITTLYNEQNEVSDFISHVYNHVDELIVVDDGSTDDTYEILQNWMTFSDKSNKIKYHRIEHTGLAEVARIQALNLVHPDSWVLVLDADERFDEGSLDKIVAWINSNPEQTHVYFDLLEFIDKKHIRTFQKARLFKKESVHLSEIIHSDPRFDGAAARIDGAIILHRKTTDKQVMREIEYLATYQKLLDEGKIDQGQYEWFVGLHYFVVPHG